PHATHLEVQCEKETKTLVNLNYPVKQTFTWSPMTCGDVMFQIRVGDLILAKKYEGYRGFPKFLADFVGGQRTFYPSDFPAEREALRRLGIESIKVKYQFKGHQPVVELLKATPGTVPMEIVTCWDQ
ncbi:MAG: type VI secretion system protein ImpL, partial [Thermodesulfobacteriota bacterium]|nr:type VI secretion system protein ImpL [Thermodesulfobacteriota bacterium]